MALQVLVIVISVFIAENVFSAPRLSRSAQAILNQLPEKKVSLDVVLGLGVRGSDQAQLINSEAVTKDISRLEVESLLDSRIKATSGIIYDGLSPTGNIDVTGKTTMSGNASSLAYEKLFSSGTSLTAQFDMSSTKSHTVKSFENNIKDIDQIEYKTTLNLRQQLWKNFLGRSIREGLKAGKYNSKSIEKSVQNQIDDFIINLVDIYYNSWMAQAKVFVDQAKLARQRRLLNITRIQKRRGNAVEANVLQIKAAKGFTEQQLKDSELVLADLWRNMVTVLKLPPPLLNVDPKLIPMTVDQHYKKALLLCKRNPDGEKATKDSPQLQQALLLKQAADLKLSSEKRESSPQLALDFKLVRNGVSTDTEKRDLNGFHQGTTSSPESSVGPLQEALFGGYMQTSIGVYFEMPLGNVESKSKLASAVKSQVQANSSLSRVRGELSVSWLNACNGLKRSSDKLDAMISIYKDQIRRSRIEEKRFKLGRISAFEVISAGNDVSDAEVAVADARRGLRINAWRVIRLSGGLKSHLEQIPPIKVSF